MSRPDDEQRAIEEQLRALCAKYGDLITDEQELRDQLLAFRQRAESVRRFPLSLDDEPLLHLAPKPQERAE
jgi:hypothetical protein